MKTKDKHTSLVLQKHKLQLLKIFNNFSVEMQGQNNILWANQRDKHVSLFLHAKAYVTAQII